MEPRRLGVNVEMWAEIFSVLSPFKLLLVTKFHRRKTMYKMHPIAAFTYTLGWISAIAVFVYHALVVRGTVTSPMGFSSRNLLELTLLSFVISIASDARSVANRVKSRKWLVRANKTRTAPESFQRWI